MAGLWDNDWRMRDLENGKRRKDDEIRSILEEIERTDSRIAESRRHLSWRKGDRLAEWSLEEAEKKREQLNQALRRAEAGRKDCERRLEDYRQEKQREQEREERKVNREKVGRPTNRNGCGSGCVTFFLIMAVLLIIFAIITGNS